MSREQERRIEETLERLWTQREQAQPATLAFLERSLDFDPQAALAEAQRRGWVRISGESFELTGRGEAPAAGVIRRHRLAERLLADVIGVDATAMEAGACELEHSHILSQAATERVCAFLGHPPTCPHERPIPRGRCCDKLSGEVRALVTPLQESAIGHDYRIVFVASRSHRRLDRLAAFGILPGASLHLHQRLPTFIVRVGGTDVALEEEIAADIFVVPA